MPSALSFAMVTATCARLGCRPAICDAWMPRSSSVIISRCKRSLIATCASTIDNLASAISSTCLPIARKAVSTIDATVSADVLSKVSTLDKQVYCYSNQRLLDKRLARGAFKKAKRAHYDEDGNEVAYPVFDEVDGFDSD